METKTQAKSESAATQEEPTEMASKAPTPAHKTPQEYYAEVTNRIDIRVILEALASNQDCRNT